MHVNKVHYVTTIPRVAEDLGEDEDPLTTSPTKWMPRTPSSGSMGVGEDGVMAFTDFGIENLVELIKIYKENPGLLGR